MFAPAGDETEASARDDSEVQLAVMPDSLTDTLFPGAAGAEEVPGQGHPVLDPRPAPGQVGGAAPGVPGGEGEAEGQGPQPGQDRPEDRRPPGQARPAGAGGEELGPHVWLLDLDPYIMAASDLDTYIMANLDVNGNMCPGGN